MMRRTTWLVCDNCGKQVINETSDRYESVAHTENYYVYFSDSHAIKPRKNATPILLCWDCSNELDEKYNELLKTFDKRSDDESTD